MSDALEQQVTITAPKRLIRAIEEIAKAENRSRSAQMRYMLERAIESRPPVAAHVQSTPNPR